VPKPTQKPEKGILVLNRVRIWGIVYVTIAGTERPGAKVQLFEYLPDKKTLLLDIQNTGNVYLRLKPLLTYKNAAGEVVATKELSEKVLLRDHTLRYRIPANEIPEDAVLASVVISAKGLSVPLYAETTLK